MPDNGSGSAHVIGSVLVPGHNPMTPKYNVLWPLGGGQYLLVYYGVDKASGTTELLFRPLHHESSAFRLTFDIRSHGHVVAGLRDLANKIEKL